MVAGRMYVEDFEALAGFPDGVLTIDLLSKNLSHSSGGIQSLRVFGRSHRLARAAAGNRPAKRCRSDQSRARGGDRYRSRAGRSFANDPVPIYVFGYLFDLKPNVQLKAGLGAEMVQPGRRNIGLII